MVLDYVTYSINGSEPSEETEVLLADTKIRPALGLSVRGGGMLQPWMTAKKILEKKADVTLNYEFESETTLHEPVYLLIEEADNFNISINGNEIEKIYKNGIFIDKCFYRIEVSKYITTGKNVISLTTGYKENTNLETIYLLGDFCVSMPEKKIISSDNKVTFGSLVEKGFPFYGGKVKYTLSFSRTLAKNERAFLKLSGYENTACFEVNNKIIPFPPYECDVTDELNKRGTVEATLYLTRRNMFGPLHGIEKHPVAIGPDHFYGGNSKEYVLFESGILEKPCIEIRTNGGDTTDVR